jgi:transcriptional regulator with XRE-family HTH domain
MTNITFADRFRDVADETCLRDSELGAALGVSQSTVSAWRSGARSPKAPTVAQVAAWFGVTPEWLSGKDAPKYPPPAAQHTVEARIISHGVDAMPPEQRERALTMFRLVFEQYADKFEEDPADDA